MIESYMMLDSITWWPSEIAFFPSIVMHLFIWSLTAPINLVDNSGSASGSSECFWRILTPEQYHVRMSFTIKRGSYSLVACPRASCLVIA